MTSKSAKLAHTAEFKFRPLKKNLSHSFKLLRQTVDSGTIPDKKTIEQFLELVSLMVSYSGFGDEFYASFKDACDKLRLCDTSKDLASFSQQLQQIHSLKKQCHNRFRQASFTS